MITVSNTLKAGQKFRDYNSKAIITVDKVDGEIAYVSSDNPGLPKTVDQNSLDTFLFLCDPILEESK